MVNKTLFNECKNIYLTAKHKSGNDVYYKAAHVLHSIRYVIGKDILWKTLKEFLNMPKELENNQTSTKEFVSLLNENSESAHMVIRPIPIRLARNTHIIEKSP